MKKVNLNLRINEEMRDEFYKVAEQKVQTPSALIRNWIENYINENKEMDKMNENFGVVKFEGKTYTLKQPPYAESGVKRMFVDLVLDDERPFYAAAAVDIEGNEYTVIWDVKDEWVNIDDEQEMCNWSNPDTVQ